MTDEQPQPEIIKLDGQANPPVRLSGQPGKQSERTFYHDPKDAEMAAEDERREKQKEFDDGHPK